MHRRSRRRQLGGLHRRYPTTTAHVKQSEKGPAQGQLWLLGVVGVHLTGDGAAIDFCPLDEMVGSVRPALRESCGEREHLSLPSNEALRGPGDCRMLTGTHGIRALRDGPVASGSESSI